MKTIVNLLFCPDGRDDPTAEVRIDDPKVIPAVGDHIQFDSDAESVGGDYYGVVTERVFYHLPFHIEVDVVAEPVD